jgi:hypothetical protein
MQTSVSAEAGDLVFADALSLVWIADALPFAPG